MENLQVHGWKEFAASPSIFMLWQKRGYLICPAREIMFSVSDNKRGAFHGSITATIIGDVVGTAMFSFNEDYFYTTTK